jgi:hypothetical protein
MNGDNSTRARSIVLLVSLALLLAACATGVVPKSTAPVASPAETPIATPSEVHATEVNNGSTVTVSVGSEVTLELASTYWQVGDSSDPAVLALVSGPTASAAAMGACVPGGGCGTVMAAFRALAPGRATITASRTTCGEAMRCTGADGAYEVTVVVRG